MLPIEDLNIERIAGFQPFLRFCTLKNAFIKMRVSFSYFPTLLPSVAQFLHEEP